MRPDARIQAAIDLLDRIWVDTKPADGVVSLYFRNNRYAGSKDRAAITEQVYRILRRYARLGWWLAQHDIKKTGRALVIADLVFENTDVDVCFTGEKYAPDILSASEEELVAALQGQSLVSDEMPKSVRLEMPDTCADDIEDDLARALMEPATVDLRVNILKTTRDNVLAALRDENIKIEPTPYSPWGLRLTQRLSVVTHPLYRAGDIEIQDEASQLIALVADVKPGQQVSDFCAGAGGKSLALGAMMQNKGRIVATDVLPRRLKAATQRFRRAGLHNIETRALDSENDKWVKRHKHHFDVVLVDAPCSGSGTWRRHPDLKWRQLGPTLEALMEMQAKILSSAARMVKPGGRLVYATCSLFASENEKQAAAFLAKHPDFKTVDISALVADANPWLKLTPASHKTDGFFAAVFERQS